MGKLVSNNGTVVQALLYEEKPKSDGKEYAVKIAFVVSTLRKRGDLKIVRKQIELSSTAKLSRYGQSLLDSCFKNW